MTQSWPKPAQLRLHVGRVRPGQAGRNIEVAPMFVGRATLSNLATCGRWPVRWGGNTREKFGSTRLHNPMRSVGVLFGIICVLRVRPPLIMTLLGGVCLAMRATRHNVSVSAASHNNGVAHESIPNRRARTHVLSCLLIRFLPYCTSTSRLVDGEGTCGEHGVSNTKHQHDQEA